MPAIGGETHVRRKGRRVFAADRMPRLPGCTLEARCGPEHRLFTRLRSMASQKRRASLQAPSHLPPARGNRVRRGVGGCSRLKRSSVGFPRARWRRKASFALPTHGVGRHLENHSSVYGSRNYGSRREQAGRTRKSLWNQRLGNGCSRLTSRGCFSLTLFGYFYLTLEVAKLTRL